MPPRRRSVSRSRCKADGSKQQAQAKDDASASAFSIVLSCLLAFAERYIFTIVQLYFDWPIYYLKRMWNWFEHVSHDGQEVMTGLKLERNVFWGQGRLERYNLLIPTESDVPIRGIVFNIHGGGFVCSRDECYYPSMAAIARQRYIIVGLDYPTSPQARAPDALVAVLKGLNHARRQLFIAARHLRY